MVTISIGVAFSKQTSEADFENLIVQADQAAYQAKNRGRDKVCAAWDL